MSEENSDFLKKIMLDLEKSINIELSGAIYGASIHSTHSASTVFNKDDLDKAIKLVADLGPAPDWIKCIRYSKKNRKSFYEWVDSENLIKRESIFPWLTGFNILESAYIPAGKMLVEFNSGKIGFVDVSNWEVDEDQP
jgi:hypothetical protein